MDVSDITPQNAERLLLAALIGQVNAGKVAAARQAMSVIAEMRANDATREHEERLAGLAGDTAGLLRYLGELDASVHEAARRLGRALTPEDEVELEAGRAARRLAVRAAQLELVRAGRRPPDPWMG